MVQSHCLQWFVNKPARIHFTQLYLLAGQGLGKTNDGIVKPIKATFKFDSTGLGHDAAAADFNNHWWERVYNDAASNVKVSKDGENKPQIQIHEEDGVDISTASINYKKMKKKHGKMAGFGTFVKTATLTNTGHEDPVEEQVDLEEFRHNTVKPMTDEELFAACGGRTAHKGARHGLKLSGKLARLAEQDAKLLRKYDLKSSTISTSVPADDDADLKGILYQTEYTKKLSKRKKKAQNKIDNELSESLDSFSLQSPTRQEEDEKFHRLNDQHGGSGIKKKKKKTKKLKEAVVNAVSSLLEDIRGSKSDDEVAPKKKKDKSSKKDYKSDDDVVQRKEKRKKKEKVYLEPQGLPEDEDACMDPETDVTELEDSMAVDPEASAKKNRLSKSMKPKRKRNRDQKAEKKLAKALAASLVMEQEDDEDH